MMGAYGPPYMPLQGPHEGLLSVAPMSPYQAGGPHLPPHHLQQGGMPGYPGMLHHGKGLLVTATPDHLWALSAPRDGLGHIYRLSIHSTDACDDTGATNIELRSLYVRKKKNFGFFKKVQVPS